MWTSVRVRSPVLNGPYPTLLDFTSRNPTRFSWGRSTALWFWQEEEIDYHCEVTQSELSQQQRSTLHRWKLYQSFIPVLKRAFLPLSLSSLLVSLISSKRGGNILSRASRKQMEIPIAREGSRELRRKAIAQQKHLLRSQLRPKTQTH